MIETGWVLLDGQIITVVGSGIPPKVKNQADFVRIDAGGLSLAPGLIDLHVHGAAGHEIMDGSVDSIYEIARFLARHGVTSFLAATWTAPKSATQKALDEILKAFGKIPGGATLLGAYLEGPYLNPNRAGAQEIDWIHPASDHEEAMAFLKNKIVRVVVLAPEFPENMWLIEECQKQNITVSAGHTAASYEEMHVAVSRGVRQVTHCFNAMSPLHHRRPGVVGAAMTIPELRCELIADNVHVHPVAQNILFQLRGPDGIVLVSDSTRCTGLPDGEYDWDGRKVTLKNNAVRLPDGTLAGSILTLDRAVQNFKINVNAPLENILPCASLNPARAIGIDHRKGTLEPDKDADLFLFDADFQIKMTLAEGQIVYTI